jgi:ABC transporter fused permease/ATP-binding protein
VTIEVCAVSNSQDRPRRLTLKRLVELARPEAVALSMGTVSLILAAGLNLLYPKFVQRIIDGVLEGAGREVVNGSASLLLVLFAVAAVFTGLRSYLFTVAGERVVARLRTDVYRAVISQEIGFFDERRTGELINRLSSDTTVLQSAVTVNISMFLRFFAMGLGSLIILFFSSWRLTLVMLLTVPLVALGASWFGRVVRRISREAQDALADANNVAEETIGGVRTVRAFAREKEETERYGAAVERSFVLAKERARVASIFAGTASFGAYAAIAVVLWYGGILLADGRLTMGELTSFLLYTFTLAMSIAALSGLWQDFMKAVGASERVFELVDRTPLVGSGERTPTKTEGAVRFERVEFAYPTRPDSPVLTGLDLELAPGRVVALVGPSGGGKSTVAALLSRFYDPLHGRVLLDDVDYRELNADWLRRQVGVVSQEPILFATSIRENILYGRSAASIEDVVAAAKAANAHEFITEFTAGYDTMVGERGVRLSGGQKQRVAIARALLKDPRILVLDEATSALDAESEHLVQEALARLMAGRTTLVIAHRLSTVKEADCVLVLDGGRVVQSGSHGELVEQEGLYRRLVQRQLRGAA